MGKFTSRMVMAAAGLVLASSAALGGPCQGTRVVGGEPADIRQHRWQVALESKAGFCGGTFIAENWVLTAAHCVPDAPQDASGRMQMKAGVSNVKSGAWIETERVIVHPDYDPATSRADLALINFRKEIAAEEIALASSASIVAPCTMLEVTGWGRTSEGGKASDGLRKAMLPVVDKSTCNAPQAYNGYVREWLLCAGYEEGGIDTCQGDSGGPMVLRSPQAPPLLVGVVSGGIGCARRDGYGLYTSVAYYRAWIDDVLSRSNK